MTSREYRADARHCVDASWEQSKLIKQVVARIRNPMVSIGGLSESEVENVAQYRCGVSRLCQPSRSDIRHARIPDEAHGSAQETHNVVKWDGDVLQYC